MSKLFDGSDDDADDLQISTNQDYAKSFNSLRKKELLQKYKDRGLDVSESELDSDSESSEEEEVDVKFDQEFFKTLASLKSKDPRIYDKETRFFDAADGDESDSEEEGSPKKKPSKAKPVTLKDYERKVILEHNGKFESSDDEKEAEEEFQRAQSPTAVEEEQRLKAEFKNVMEQEDDGEDEEFGGIFKKRTKTKAQTDAEEADFAKWLAGKQADESIEPSAQQQLAPLKQYWNSSKLTQGESFLRDYILNKGYANTDASEIPTYDEIVGDNAPLSDDEQELEKQAEFEQKYNFRFEEPDADFIKRYPRTIEQSIRRSDDKRKEKRKEVKERKQHEKEQKMKELDLIKDMRKKEIEEKIRKLKAVTGNDELGFRDDELDEDFDPEAHDRRMQELFNDDYYNVDEGEEKPECPSDIEELAIEDWDNYDPRQSNDADEDGHCEDDDFNMDCDYDPASSKQQLQQELIENTRSRKGRKGRRNRFMEMIKAEKPAFDPEDEQTYGDYIDEYYQLDYEDIVGDQPCRFKYVETTPNDFGLTIEEILLAKNKELNQWASLKKAVQNRPEYVEKKEQRLYKMKAKNEDLKRKIFKSLYGDPSDDEEQTEEPNETKPAVNEQAAVPVAGENSTETLSKSKRKRLKRKAAAAAAGSSAPASSSTTLSAPVTITNGNEEKNNAENSDKPTKQQDSALKDAPTPAKKKKVEKVQPPAKKEAEKGNTKNPFAKKQFPNKNVANPKEAGPNPFNKQNMPKPGPVGVTSGANPFKNAGNKSQTPRREGGDFKPRPKRDFKGKGKPNNSNPNESRPKRDFKGKGKPNNSNPNGITDDRLKAYGINPRKFHNRQKYGKKEQ
ncbi:protein KRI1 homolog [Drosophila innubila]|uniref:protein KRI1 homolog n=1 Tax=Drosophila innubila TaxID=198719 RepID=UPI00148D0E5A|nr:protein KRI1 homolog [Drosophila innubila]